MNEETRLLVGQTLREAEDFGLVTEVVCSMLVWMYGDRTGDYLHEWVQNACIDAKKEWDV